MGLTCTLHTCRHHGPHLHAAHLQAPWASPARYTPAGTMGLKGNLFSAEILEQLVHALAATSGAEQGAGAGSARIRNVVFMVCTVC